MHEPARRSRKRSALALIASGVLVGTSGAVILGPATGNASSHREAPLIAGDPKADNTDVYAFTSPDNPDNVTLIANWIPFEDPAGGPNFYPFADDGARYNINIDSNGDGTPDIVYRWTFKTQDDRGSKTFLYNNGPVKSIDDQTLLFRQTYTLEKITNGSSETLVSDAKVAPSNVGAASMPNYAALRDEAITPVGNGGKSFAGQADDPFFLDLRIFDLLYGGDLSEAGNDTLNGYNVNTIALQVPKSDVALSKDPDRNPVIGVWSTTERQTLQLSPGKATPSGEFVQVSRLGNPLVNEVVVPSELKDAFNSLTPDKDSTVQPVVDRVLDPEVPQLLEKIYGIPAPAAPRKDLQEIFLTGIAKENGPIAADLNSQTLNKDVDKGAFKPSEELRLNMSVPVTENPDRLGVLAKDLQGFPNGRRLTDDVVDIELQALEGAAQSGKLVTALAAGDGVNNNDKQFGSSFPYVALPHSGSATRGSSSDSDTMNMPNGGVATGGGGAAAGSGGPGALPVGLGAVGFALTGFGVLRLRRRTGTAGARSTTSTSTA